MFSPSLSFSIAGTAETDTSVPQLLSIQHIIAEFSKIIK